MNLTANSRPEIRSMDQNPLPPYLKGLTDAQIQAFKAFEALCEKKDLRWPRSKLEDGSQHRSNDGYTLLYVQEI